jgi:type II secretory pathway pseudopilin PulG
MRRKRQRGVGYLFMLLAVAVLSLGIGKAVEVYTTSAQREREAELVHVGALYRQAIKDYYLSAPGGQHRYPARLEDLLKDSRHLVTRRYLRQLYVDPMTAQAFTPLFAPQGGVWGVASSSSKSPIRAKSPNEATVGTRSAPSYRDWRFIYDGA